jgi:hypothetical protein
VASILRAPAAIPSVQRCGGEAHDGCPCAEVDERHQDGTSAASVTVARQIATGPPGRDPCMDLLEQIIALLDDVAKRFNDALDDEHGLFTDHRRVRDAHPTHGSWDGHADRYRYDQERLRTKLAEWEADDRCRGFPLSSHEEQEMAEAREFAHRPFPDRPAPAVARAQEESVWDRLRKYLSDHLVTVLMGVITVAAAAALVACFVTGACEIGLVLAGAGALVVIAVTAALRAAGVRDQPTA